MHVAVGVMVVLCARLIAQAGSRNAERAAMGMAGGAQRSGDCMDARTDRLLCARVGPKFRTAARTTTDAACRARTRRLLPRIQVVAVVVMVASGVATAMTGAIVVALIGPSHTTSSLQQISAQTVPFESWCCCSYK